MDCDAYALYRELCRRDGVRHDPCVLDVLLSLVDFMQGGAAPVYYTHLTLPPIRIVLFTVKVVSFTKKQ